MAARGHLGGLAGTTAEAAAVLDACGFDLILIETVGTGQSEVEVASIADTTVVVQAPEMGDEVQALKAGLLEVADLVVVNKADRPGAERTAADLRGHARGRLASRSRRPTDETRPADRDRSDPKSCWHPGSPDRGSPSCWLSSTRRGSRLAGDTDHAQAVRLARAVAQVTGILLDRTRDALGAAERREATEATLRAVAAHELDPYAAADRLMAPPADRS